MIHTSCYFPSRLRENSSEDNGPTAASVLYSASSTAFLCSEAINQHTKPVMPQYHPEIRVIYCWGHEQYELETTNHKVFIKVCLNSQPRSMYQGISELLPTKYFIKVCVGLGGLCSYSWGTFGLEEVRVRGGIGEGKGWIMGWRLWVRCGGMCDDVWGEGVKAGGNGWWVKDEGREGEHWERSVFCSRPVMTEDGDYDDIFASL